MDTKNLSIPAGQSIVVFEQGIKFQILQGSSLTIELQKNFSTVYTATGVGAGMWAKPDGGFTSVKITNTTGVLMPVTFFVTMGDAGYDQPVATLSVSGQISNQPVLDQTITQDPQQTIGTVASVVVAADSTRRGLRLLSPKINTGFIYLGNSGVTSNSPMYLNPGDYYDETQVPGAAWYAIASAAGQLLNVMEIH